MSAPTPGPWRARAELFGGEARELRAERREFTFRYRSAAHWVEVFRTWNGPIHRAFASLAPERQGVLATELVSLIERVNVARDGTMVVPSPYLEAVIARA